MKPSCQAKPRAAANMRGRYVLFWMKQDRTPGPEPLPAPGTRGPRNASQAEFLPLPSLTYRAGLGGSCLLHSLPAALCPVRDVKQEDCSFLLFTHLWRELTCL